MISACDQNVRRQEIFKIIIVIPTGKKPPERPKRRWENNLLMGFKK